MTLAWKDVLQYARDGAPAPERRVEKSDAEWRAQLSAAEYQVTRQAGTERAVQLADVFGLFEPGRYACRCCGTVLFDASPEVRVRHRLAVVHAAAGRTTRSPTMRTRATA